MSDFLLMVGGGRPGKSAHALRMIQRMAPEPTITHPWFLYWFPAGSSGQERRLTFDLASYLAETRRRRAWTFIKGAGVKP